MKRNMKKTAAILGVALAMSLMAGCGETAEKETKEIVAGGSVAEESSSEAASEAASPVAEPENAAAVSSDVSIEEQVLVEQDDVTITAQEYVSDSIFGDGIKVLLDNQSDKDILVGCNALIVNDYMIQDLFGAEVAAGKKSNEVVYLSSDELEAAGIDSVGKIEIYFNVSDANSYDTLFSTDCVTIQTSAFDQMDTTPNDAGTELYNENGIRIVGKTVDENSFWGAAILLYCENTSDRDVCIQVDDMSVNGFMMDPFFSTTVYAGKKAIDDITLMSEDLEQNGIISIDEIELKFNIFDNDSFDTIADSDPITFSAQ